MDHNETACGACRRIGELLCCEGCVAAFHVRCAGYDSQSEVPAGDWYCWFCAKNKGLKYQHPTTLFKAPRTQQMQVMLAVDDEQLDRFNRCQVLAISERYVELKTIDLERDTDIVHRSSRRLWHGSVDKNAWSIEDDGVTWRPNSRLFELDTDTPHSSKAAASSRQQRPGRESRPQAVGRPPASAGGAGRVPDGEVGAGLPVIKGGAGQEEFDSALNGLWKNLLGSGYPERMPQCLLVPGHPVEPWYVWREVWSWGGPDVITDNKLWATVGFSFNVPYTSSAASSRIKKSYDLLIAPLDQAISAGDIQLQRPAKCRLPQHRAMQIRPPIIPGDSPAVRSGSTVLRTVSGGGGSAGGRRGRPRKRRQRGGWSSSDDEPAPDFGSDYEDPDESGLSGAVSGSGSGEEGSQEEASSQEQEEQEDEQQEEPSSEAEAEEGTPPPKRARTFATLRAAAASGGGGRSRVQLAADSEVLGRITLSPAAQQIKVGSVVDFRLISPEGTCATGWRSGTVLAVEPGSAWEGGKWMLIQPRHHHHNKYQQQQGLKPPADGPAAAALAAVTAAGCEGPAADAAQKLLTPAGHLRQELAGLIQPPVKPGSPTAHTRSPAAGTGAAAGEQRQLQVLQAADASAAASEDAVRPVWVSAVWRGSFSSPLPRPVVMIRSHYSGASYTIAGQLVSSGSSQLLRSQQQGLSTTDIPSVGPSQQAQQQQQQVSMDRQHSLSSIYTGLLTQQQVAVGTSVEVLRQGSWWPATVIAVKGPGLDRSPSAGTVAASLSDAPSASQAPLAGLGSIGDVGCIVLRNDDAPEADGAVWRCSRTHALRPAHPQHSSHFGMLVLKRENMMSLAALRKQLQPYTYAGNIQAFSCLHHMRPEFGRA